MPAQYTVVTRPEKRNLPQPGAAMPVSEQQQGLMDPIGLSSGAAGDRILTDRALTERGENRCTCCADAAHLDCDYTGERNRLNAIVAAVF